MIKLNILRLFMVKGKSKGLLTKYGDKMFGKINILWNQKIMIQMIMVIHN